MHEPDRGARRVVACSHQAASLGVAVGMPLAEAAALVGMAQQKPAARGFAGGQEEELQIAKCKLQIANCPTKPQAASSTAHSPLSTPHSPQADREALEALAERCRRFSPIVGLEQSAMPESLLLDVTGLAHLFGGEASLGEKIVGDFARRGLTVRVAIADTIGAAWAAAHFDSSFCDSAFSIQHSSFTLVPPGQAAAALRPLPIEALRLPGKIVDLLHQLGVTRIGQLEALPRREFPSRFGPELLRRMDQAAGRVAEPVPACEPPPEFRADWSPEHPTARRETIEAALEQLVRRVAKLLARRGHGAVRLECRLDCVSGGMAPVDPLEVSLGLFEPSASARHLFGLVQVQFERLRLPGPVAAIRVTAAATAPLRYRQQGLFPDGEGSPRRHGQHLASLVDRLSNRLGPQSVVGARLGCDAQPELAWRSHPLVDGSRRRVRRKTTASGLPPRPLRLLRRPIALAATSIMPEGPPLRFHLRGREHQVAHTWGPERIETGWWRGRAVGRDYYRIETTTGRRFWLFRRLRDGRWFMHGMFE